MGERDGPRVPYIAQLSRHPSCSSQMRPEDYLTGRGQQPGADGGTHNGASCQGTVASSPASRGEGPWKTVCGTESGVVCSGLRYRQVAWHRNRLLRVQADVTVLCGRKRSLAVEHPTRRLSLRAPHVEPVPPP